MTGWARDARYSTVAIAFHWTIAVLIIHTSFYNHATCSFIYLETNTFVTI